MHDSNSNAALIVWDFNLKTMLFRVKYHKQQVQNLSFNCDDTFLISVGGPEDRNQLVCWNLIEGRSEAAQPAVETLNQETTDVKFYSKDPTKFITGHNNGVKF
jgi:WD40 repeat protein